jgi:hypothetical protein
MNQKIGEIPSLKLFMDKGNLRLHKVFPSGKIFLNPIKRKTKRVKDAQEH